MKLGKKKLFVGMICLILCFSMTACSEETAKNLAQDIDDQVSNLKDIDESHVVSVEQDVRFFIPISVMGMRLLNSLMIRHGSILKRIQEKMLLSLPDIVCIGKRR